MRIHHIGYLVKNIDKAVNKFISLGYKLTSLKTHDEIRKIDIVFMSSGDYCIELVSPYAEDSVVSNLIKKIGNTPYHICYNCKNIEETVELLTKEKFIQVDEPKIAPACGGHRVCFLFNNSIGLIELLEE